LGGFCFLASAASHFVIEFMVLNHATFVASVIAATVCDCLHLSVSVVVFVIFKIVKFYVCELVCLCSVMLLVWCCVVLVCDVLRVIFCNIFHSNCYNVAIF
jgi:hypothetical protein